jgi:hypothetical protein
MSWVCFTGAFVTLAEAQQSTIGGTIARRARRSVCLKKKVMTKSSRNGLVAMVMLTLATAASGQSARRRLVDGRDALLAALGSLTIECLGTFGPSSYSTEFGVLARTFNACRAPETQALSRIDALLGLQTSMQGRRDGLAAHYTARWNAFVGSFPYDRIQECPTWRLLDVIDAPTFESVGRHLDRRRDQGAGSPPIGKQNARYRVTSSECGGDPACSTHHAATCAAGFGDQFLVELDFQRGRIEVDPAWWLTHYEYEDDKDNPFKQPGFYHPMSYYGSPPGSLYGAIERNGERCSQYHAPSGKHYTDRFLQLIDCTDGDGWYCMTYCMEGPYSSPPLGR